MSKGAFLMRLVICLDRPAPTRSFVGDGEVGKPVVRDAPVPYSFLLKFYYIM